MTRKELLKAIHAAKEVLVSVHFVHHDIELVKITKREASFIVKTWPSQDDTVFEAIVCGNSTLIIGK